MPDRRFTSTTYPSARFPSQRLLSFWPQVFRFYQGVPSEKAEAIAFAAVYRFSLMHEPADLSPSTTRIRLVSSVMISVASPTRSASNGSLGIRSATAPSSPAMASIRRKDALSASRLAVVSAEGLAVGGCFGFAGMLESKHCGVSEVKSKSHMWDVFKFSVPSCHENYAYNLELSSNASGVK